MPATMSKAEQSLLRRQEFREYMRKLNPIAPAQTAIDSGLVLDNLHSSLFRTMAARADLDPGSQQLLVGGIGSGKTTELLMASALLERQGQTLPIYIDISSETDLSVLNSGALLAGFGLHLSSTLVIKKTASFDAADRDNIHLARTKIKEFAFGITTQTWISEDEDEPQEQYGGPEDYEPGRFVTRTVPGKLKPPFPALQRDIQEIYDSLRACVQSAKKYSLEVVVILDGLDRLISPDKFWAVVHQDLRVVRRLGVAVIVAAPLSVLYGKGRAIPPHFDRVHTIPPLTQDTRDNVALQSVLVHRGANTLLKASGIELICLFSGGILRDLISLARDAGEAAYIDESKRVGLEHVNLAIDQLGESYLRGLGQNQLKTLNLLHAEHTFDVTSDANVELLVTGRVLEHSATDFSVHPALWRMIERSNNRV